MKLICKDSETPLFRQDSKLQIFISFERGKFQLKDDCHSTQHFDFKHTNIFHQR